MGSASRSSCNCSIDLERRTVGNNLLDQHILTSLKMLAFELGIQSVVEWKMH